MPYCFKSAPYKTLPKHASTQTHYQEPTANSQRHHHHRYCQHAAHQAPLPGQQIGHTLGGGSGPRLVAQGTADQQVSGGELNVHPPREHVLLQHLRASVGLRSDPVCVCVCVSVIVCASRTGSGDDFQPNRTCDNAKVNRSPLLIFQKYLVGEW